MQFFDLDELLIRRAEQENIVPPATRDQPPGEPRIRSVYRALGSARFGVWEADAIRSMPRMPRQPHTVLATGGGVCDHPDTMRLLTETFHVLYLRNDPIVLYERASRRGIPAFLDQHRPREHFLEIAHRRDALYRRYADKVVDVAGLSVAEAIARIIADYRE
jgi:shikimate kinase